MEQIDKKLSLYKSIAELEKLMFAIDNEPGEIDAHTQAEFKDLTEGRADATDRAHYRLCSFDLLIDAAKRDCAGADLRLDKLQKAKESFERHITSCVRSVSTPLRGEKVEFSVKLNPGRVEFSVPVSNKSLSNVVTGEFIDDIPQEFLEKVEFFRIRKDEVAKSLKAGEPVKFATLIRGTKLCQKELKTLLS